LLVKLGANDYLPTDSIDPILSATYAKWLVEIGVDAIEISCGSTMYSPFTCARGDVPLKDLMSMLPLWQRPLAWLKLRGMVGKYDLDQEGFNLDAIQTIRPKTGNTPLIAVGGFRSLSVMEEALKSGSVDMISLSRPLVREPNLIQKFQDGRSTKATCCSCNRCFVAIANQLPLKCYCNNGNQLKKK
ncbi:MAG: oxidoreductase, partial [Candidatus Hodarchaeales archaeon]